MSENTLMISMVVSQCAKSYYLFWDFMAHSNVYIADTRVHSQLQSPSQVHSSQTRVITTCINDDKCIFINHSLLLKNIRC